MNKPGPKIPKSRSTLHDVAQMAGVSPTTVSLVLAGKATTRRISQETHQKVHGAAAALGYTPNLLHRSMRRGRTHVLSLYNSFRNREWSDLYMDRLSAAVEHAGGSFGYDVLVHCNFNRDTKETYEFLNGGLSDGLILFGPAEDEPLLPLLRASNHPTVLIGARNQEQVLSTVQDDVTQGMRMVAEALAQHGHRRIVAVVEEIQDVLDPTGRFDRLKAELGERGVSFDERDVVLWQGSAEAVVDEVLARSTRPTALFVWHDRAAYRIIEICEARGLRIPDDLTVVAYDGLVWPSTTSHVVASVAVALDEVARVAVKQLHAMIEGEATPQSQSVSVSFLPGTTLGSPYASFT